MTVEDFLFDRRQLNMLVMQQELERRISSQEKEPEAIENALDRQSV